MKKRKAGIVTAAVLGLAACTSSPPEGPVAATLTDMPQPELECDSTEGEVGTADYGEDAAGVHTDPVTVVREYLGEAVVTYDLQLGLLDEPRRSEPVVGVERDGQLIGLYYLIEAPAGGGLLIGGMETCVDEALMGVPSR